MFGHLWPLAAARAWVLRGGLGHAQRKQALMTLLGLLTALEFFENTMFVFGAAHIMGGIDAAPEEFVRAQAAYAVGSLVAMVLQQRLAQRFGYRRYLSGAVGLFVLGLLGCAQSQGIGQMVVARLVQGAGGGAFFTSSRVLVTQLFALADRPPALRRFMALVFGASAIAPASCAWLIEHWGWPWVFYCVLPAALLVWAGVWLLLPSGAGRVPGTRLMGSLPAARAAPASAAGGARWRRTLGRLAPGVQAAVPLLWFALGVVCLQLAVSQARFDVLAHPGRLALMGASGVAVLGAFLWRQWHHPEPLLHLRMLHSPVYLMGLGLYFVHYFLTNFSAYLFPIYAERGLGLPLQTTGWLNSLAATGSLLAAWCYIRFMARRFTRKRGIMLAALGCMVFCALWLSGMPAGAPAQALAPALLAKGVFGALMVLPVAGLTFRELGDRRFAHGYQGKNMMRQVAASASSALAAVMLQNRTFALQQVLTGQLDPARTDVAQWLSRTGAWFAAQGLDVAQARAAAEASLGQIITTQAILLACEDLYRLLAVCALVAAAIVLAQRRLA